MNRRNVPVNTLTDCCLIFINKLLFAGTFLLISGTSLSVALLFVYLYMILSRPIMIVAHVTGWILFACLIVGFTASNSGNKGFAAVLFSPQCLLFLFIYLAFFYLNVYLLFPFFYLKKRYIIYFSLISSIIILLFFLKPFDNLLGNSRNESNFPEREENHRGIRDQGRPRFDREPRDKLPDEGGPPPGPPPNEINHNNGRPMIDIVGIILLIMVWTFSSAIQILKQWRATEKRALQAEADKANAELSFLRAQINPHFLFNTLNNIYSLVVTKNDGGPQAIMKLSQMLRYITDEATQDYVPLEREVRCISNYIDLQQLRLSKNVVIHFSVKEKTDQSKIPPLILMTFIENVFKYGISSHEPTVITIAITAKEDNIHFFCQNKIFQQPFEEDRTSIGINNAKKRLQFLYPRKHRLLIEEQTGIFTVTLDVETTAN